MTMFSMRLFGETKQLTSSIPLSNGVCFPDFDHAAYLGRELANAETALLLKIKYVQDEELNNAFYPCSDEGPIDDYLIIERLQE